MVLSDICGVCVLCILSYYSFCVFHAFYAFHAYYAFFRSIRSMFSIVLCVPCVLCILSYYLFCVFHVFYAFHAYYTFFRSIPSMFSSILCILCVRGLFSVSGRLAKRTVSGCCQGKYLPGSVHVCIHAWIWWSSLWHCMCFFVVWVTYVFSCFQQVFLTEVVQVYTHIPYVFTVRHMHVSMYYDMQACASSKSSWLNKIIPPQTHDSRQELWLWGQRHACRGAKYSVTVTRTVTRTVVLPSMLFHYGIERKISLFFSETSVPFSNFLEESSGEHQSSID